MNWLDIVLVVFAILVVLGMARQGIIKSVFSLAGLGAGVVLALRYYERLADSLPFVTPGTQAKIVAFVIIAVGVMVAAGIVAWLLTRVVNTVMLGWVNHLAGAAFGLLIAGLIVGVGLSLWVKYAGQDAVIRESRLAMLVLDLFPKALALLPKELESVRDFFQTVY